MTRKLLIIIIISTLIISCTDKKEEARLEINAGTKAMYESDTAKARQHFEKALKLDKSNAEIYYLLSNLQFGNANLDKAMELLDKAIELKPDFGEAYRSKAQIYFIRKDHKKACENFKLAKKYGIHNLDNYLKFCH